MSRSIKVPKSFFLAVLVWYDEPSGKQLVIHAYSFTNDRLAKPSVNMIIEYKTTLKQCIYENKFLKD